MAGRMPLLVITMLLATCLAMNSDIPGKEEFLTVEDHLLPELLSRKSEYVSIEGEVVDLDAFSSERAIQFGSNIYLNEAMPKISRAALWYQSHYDELTKDMQYFNWTGLNSIMSIFGQKVFPVALNGAGDVIAAGAEYGQGRAVVTSRLEWLFNNNHESMTQFVKNAVAWASKGKASPKIACKDNYKLHGFDATIPNTNPSALKGSDIDIYCFVARHSYTKEEAQQILDFVNGGGAIISGGQFWSWGGSDGDWDGRGNVIFKKLGILIGGYDWHRDPYKVADTPVADRNLYNALTTLKTDPKNAVAMNTLSRTGGYAINKYSANDAAFLEILTLAKEVLIATTNPVVFCKLSLQLTPIYLEQDPPNLDILKKAPDVATFPYETPDDAPVVDKTLFVDGNTGEYPSQFWYSGAGNWVWRSTGLYAKAGSIVTVKFPDSFAGKAQIQVGAHPDKLWGKDNLLRSPEIVMRYDAKPGVVKVFNPYGGLIFITFPHNSKLGNVNVEIKGAVESPRYVLGQTNDNEWKNTIRHLEAPWAEVEAPGNLAFVVPSSTIRSLENASRIMTFWDDQMYAANDFAGFFTERPRMERFSFDIMISGGWMHSGYPIGAFISAVPDHLNADKMYKEGTWGAFHELGHNHQWKSWTIGGKTTETGCNWWSLVMNEFLGINTDRGKADDQFNLRIHDWVMKGKPFDEWKVWLALDTYVILAQEFGWDSYTNVIVKYYSMKEINDDNEKYNTWAKLYSTEVGFNLCPYFQWFQWPLTPETIASCSALPKWTEDPLAKYEHPTAHGTCSEGWLPYGQSCFFLASDPLNWFDAEEKCAETANTHLASCMTEAEVAFLRSKTKDISKGYHLGISDAQNPGTFENLDGSKVEYLPWRSGRPDPNDYYHCAEWWKGDIWDDRCNEKQLFVCKQGPTACGPTASAQSCPKGWRYFSDRCYFFGFNSISQSEAITACSNTEGAKLVEIGSAKEMTWLKNTLLDMKKSGGYLTESRQSFHIGMKDVGPNPEGAKWLSGASALYTNWCEGEPGPTGSIRLHNYHSFCWSDTTDNHGYICERPANMAPATP